MASEQGIRQPSVGCHRIVAGRSEDLDGDVIGAGVEVGPEAGGDRVGGPVQHEGVDQTIAATVGDVVVCVAVAAQVVRIVPQLEVGVGEKRAANPTSEVGIGLEDDRLLGSDDHVGTEEPAGVGLAPGKPRCAPWIRFADI